MHFKKLRDTWSCTTSEIELLIFVLLFETNNFFFGSFDELKMYKMSLILLIKCQSTCYQKAVKVHQRFCLELSKKKNLR